MQRRQINGVEWVQAGTTQPSIGRTLQVRGAGQTCSGWLLARFNPQRCQLELQVSDSLRAALPVVIRRVRDWLDLDADPQAIHACLSADFPDDEGLRVPGALDGFELAVRAVLGQQITVAAARTLAQRLVERFGAVIDAPHAELTLLFPNADTLAASSADALGQLGIVRQRQRAIQALARACASGQLRLDAGADVTATMAALTRLPGIGDWTAHYIAMRALRWPDAFPCGDVALHKAIGVQGHKQAAQLAQARSQSWRPWRSYALLRAWNRLPAPGRAIPQEPAQGASHGN